MRKYLSIIAAALALLCPAFAGAQTRQALKLNEVMVENQTSIVDDYGEHHAWIELFNGNFAPLEISTMYLTTDTSAYARRNNLWYSIPLGDVNTRIPKRQHVVFFADGQPNKGTFHTNFTLTPGVENTIYLLDTNGDVVDAVTVPANVSADKTYARIVDGQGGIFDPRSWSVREGTNDSYITPSSANIIRDRNPKITLFANNDENGFAMTIMAMGIVFTALLVLCLCFYGIGKIGAAVGRMNKRRAQGIAKGTDEARSTSHDTGEAIAAIAMAIHEHFNAHDTESTVLTINKVKRAYSPWSSKIYGLRIVPEHHTKR